MVKRNSVNAFSISEVLVTLLVVSVLFAAAAPMLSKKIAPFGSVSTTDSIKKDITEAKKDFANLPAAFCDVEQSLITKGCCEISDYCERLGNQ